MHGQLEPAASAMETPLRRLREAVDPQNGARSLLDRFGSHQHPRSPFAASQAGGTNLHKWPQKASPGKACVGQSNSKLSLRSTPQPDPGGGQPMNANTPNSEPVPCPPPRREEQVCEQCGRFGAQAWGDRLLCPDCVALCGSCCPEFGAWDAWAEPDSSAPAPGS